MSLAGKSSVELSKLLKTKEISCKEIVDDVYSRIDNVEGKINSYLMITKDLAYSQAEKVDQKLVAGEKLKPLEGIPVSIKDNINIKGLETTCASKILKGFNAPYDATVTKKITDEGMIIVGKTNLDEFAMGSSTENSAFGPTKNPWNIDTVPGGSSGGAAASVAADECTIAFGSDTGGSIRQPASFCGVVGVKPTYGRVSRYGLVAFASSLDQIGPLTKNVEDASLAMNMICGHDKLDSTSLKIETPDFLKALNGNIKGLKVGVIKELMGEGIESGVKSALKESIKVLERLGAEIVDISLPVSDYSVATYYIIAPAEASANLSRFDGVRFGSRGNADDLHSMYRKTREEGFGPEVKRRIMIGSYVLSSGYYDAYYLKAQKARTIIRNHYQNNFKKVDLILSPTSPCPAFKFGEKSADPLSMYLSDIATISVNLAGLPAISVPCGFDNGLPVGMQLTANYFDEATMLNCAYAFEQEAKIYKQKPVI